jgi:ABC-type branched-subunit amino acid transport system ATPase component
LDTPPGASAALRVAGLGKHFGGVRALTDVTFGVEAGETVGLIGPNGSGKTTLVNCVSGVLSPSKGHVHLGRRDVTQWSRERRARAGLIRTYQNLRLFSEMTAAENVETGLLSTRRVRMRERMRRTHEALTEQGISHLERTKVADLAYGEQRRVEIARALVAEPAVLVLDEPAAGLGEEETALLKQSLRRAQVRLGFATIIIDHDVTLITDISDRIVVLNEGEVLASGSPAEITRNPAVIAAYLGTDTETEPAGARTP